MNGPTMLPARSVGPDIHVLPAALPVPGLGVLPVNAYFVEGSEPVLIDAGLAALQPDFLTRLASITDPGALRWVVLTHIDADHTGSLGQMLKAAPAARIVTNFVGMAKLGLQGFPLDRVFLLNPGQRLDAGNRSLTALTPPVYDAPETMAYMETDTGSLFSSDCCGALLPGTFESAAAVDAADLQRGLTTWATVDAPWLAQVDEQRFERQLAKLQELEPQRVLSSHLPPAEGMLDTLMTGVRAACQAPAFRGPDQADLERMMASA